MKIAIDARFLGPEGTGIGKYTEKLLENLQVLDKKNKYFVILRKANWNLFVPKSNNFDKVLVDVRWYGVKEQILIPAALLKIKPDLVHFTHFNVPLLYPGKFVVTIHDVIKSEFKGVSSTTHTTPIYRLKHAGYEFTIRAAVKRAKRIFVPSNFTKNKLTKTFSLKPEKIITTYESTDNVFIQAGKQFLPEGKIRQVLATYGVRKPFILYVGAAFPYKNLNNLLAALKFLPGELKLAYVSSRNEFVDRLLEKAKEIGVTDRLIITGFVPNEDLAVLYQQAKCLVFPSLSEGFGLPGLEAFASGCPVVCSDIPVFREIYADAAYYFDPKDPKDIASKLELIIKNSKLKIELREKGFEQVKKYSWRKMAQETLSVYRAVLSNS